MWDMGTTGWRDAGGPKARTAWALALAALVACDAGKEDEADHPGAPGTDVSDMAGVAADVEGDAPPQDVPPDVLACPAPGPEGKAPGTVAADYSLLDCAGAKQTLHGLCGTPVILVAFTYAWCPTCIEITPELDVIAEKHGGDVAVVQILLESATGNPPTAANCAGFVTKYDIASHVVLVDPLKTMDVYYDHVVDESPGRVLVIDGRTMTLLHNSSEYESDHAILYGWIEDALVAAR